MSQGRGGFGGEERKKRIGREKGTSREVKGLVL